MDDELLSRVEDAGLNASAPPQQRWIDGWIVRYSPGKARRARCINAVATGRLPIAHKLRLAADVYRRAALPMVVRITRFTLPDELDAQLERLGFERMDDTSVMVRDCLPPAGVSPALPRGMRWARLAASDFAEAVGALRGSPAEQRLAHAQRLTHSPVPYVGHAIQRDADGAVLACGQVAQEADLVGLYDVFTDPALRGQGLASLLCERLLSSAASTGAKVAYLQTEFDNHAARRVYQRLGFQDAYGYHYRQVTQAAVAAL